MLHDSPIFLTVLTVLLVIVRATPQASIYPGQKYLLSKKFSDGTIRKVKVYDHPVTREQVLDEQGSAYYILRRTKPRFYTEWKGWIGDPDENKSTPTVHVMELRPIQSRMNYLTAGVVGLG